MVARKEIKNIKVSPECKELLRVAIRGGERYEDMFLRLLEVNDRIEGRENVEEGARTDNKDIPFDVRPISKHVEGFLGEFGLKAKDVYDLVRDGQKIDYMKLRRPGAKPLDLTKTAKSLIWAIVRIIALFLTYPATSEVVTWIIR